MVVFIAQISGVDFVSIGITVMVLLKLSQCIGLGIPKLKVENSLFLIIRKHLLEGFLIVERMQII